MIDSTHASTFGTGDFERALAYAARAHSGHLRKGTRIPYLSHLLAVASLVLEDGGDEHEAIAALLHDVVEDRGGVPRLAEVKEQFGERVAAIVVGCSETQEAPKLPWRPRKDRYIAHLATAEAAAVRVSLADKVHNARSILLDYRVVGEELWRRFNPHSDQLWYYRVLANAFRAVSESSLVGELDRTVTALENIALAGALRKLATYGAVGDYSANSLRVTADNSRSYYVQFAVDERGLSCEVVHNECLAQADAFTGDDIATLLALGFQAPEDDDQSLFRVLRTETDEDYADSVALTRAVITEYFGLPRDQPLQVERSWWPEPEDASARNLDEGASKDAEEARRNPRAISTMSELEQGVEFRRRVERDRLREAAQLPELEGGLLRFVWDIVVPLDDLNTNTISIDGRVIWSEPAISMDANRFDTVKELLKERYGQRFTNLTQTERRYHHL
jgi:HD domain